MKNFSLIFSLIFSTLGSFSAYAQQTYSEAPQQVAFQEAKQFSKAELAQMLAPIALYPDSLLTHILIASTYPIEIVEAHRWLIKNGDQNSKQMAESLENFDWDASVKALVPFNKILSRLSEDLNWTQQLGDSFLQDEVRLLEAIQTLREQAKLAGNLDKMENVEVSYEDNNIIIEPLQKEIVYVPYYDARMVYGNWHWSSYPPVYWAPSHHAYVNFHNPFYWHSGIQISFNYFFSAFHWHNRHVVVVNPHRSNRYRSRQLFARGGYAKRWSHQPTHRKGVAYRSKHISQKYDGSHAKKHKIRKSSHKAQRDFKQRLASNKRFSSNRTVMKGQVNNNDSLRRKSKHNYTNVKYKESRQNKGFKQRIDVKKVTPKLHQDRRNVKYKAPVQEKGINQRSNAREMGPKRHNENSNKQYNNNKRNIKYSNRKQSQQTGSVKKHSANRAKSRDR